MNASKTSLWALLGLASLGFMACGSAPLKPEPASPESTILRGEAVELLRSPELDRIAELQELRSTGDGRLMTFAKSPNPVVRRHAVVALGRMPFPTYGEEVTGALCGALADPAVAVLAAHALGMRHDPSAAGVLQTYFNDADSKLRAAAVAAASRFDNSDLHQELMIALRDADLNVRIEAALGTALWNTDEPGAAEIDRALVDVLRPYKVIPGHTTRTAVEAELVWRTLYALARRKAALGEGPFLQYAASDIPMERLFALRGLGNLPSSPPAIALACAALSGPTQTADWRVAHAACVTLSQFKDARCFAGLSAAAEHPSFHVRAEAMRGLGSMQGEKELKKAISIIKRGLADVSTSVRSAALVASVGLVGEAESMRRIRRDLAHEDPIIRLGAAEALGHMLSGQQLEPLKALVDDPNKQVANRALELLGAFRLPELRPFLQEHLAHPDTGMRLAAVTALAMAPDASDVPFLIQAFDSPHDDISDELAYNVLESLGKLHEVAGTQEFVQRALVDPRPFLRETAVRVLKDDFGVEMGVTHVPPGPTSASPPLPGRDFPVWSFNPLVELITARGSMIFELFPAEAPTHVVNFIELAESGAYDGLDFHRVVSNFVAQGGDYRGDGNGGKSWRGTPLRHEISPRRYTTGSLGMPRNRDLESGGGQFFITHLPTPHLDGRYTIFGELRTGRAVLDDIELGDRIFSVRLIRP